MSRLPIRLRLTAVFVVVMGAVLLIIGLFLYYRTEHNLDDSIDAALRSRQSALRGYVGSVAPGTRSAIPPGESLAQLLTTDGRVIKSRPATGKPVLTPAEARRAARAITTIERHEHSRYLAGPARLGGRPVVVVAGTSLAERERALEGLGGALLVGLPLALLLAAGIAYAVAAAALAPVEDIRGRAETIIRADPDSRVPVPETDDEVRRLAQTLNDMLQRLARAAVHERSFVANASHELRTPLAALQTEIELALRHDGSAQELRAALRRCQGDTRRLIDLADDLLVLARADDGPDAVRETTDVDDLLAEVAAQVRHDAEAQGRTVSVRPSGLSLEVDPAAMARAVRNLADNALIHGRGAIALGAELRDGGRTAVIAVIDEGELEDPDIGRHAFDRFFRGREATGRPGAGLGLALVQAVASDHGGAARLEPGPDGGSRASLVLPFTHH
jgi:signal transduction histidine kinase